MKKNYAYFLAPLVGLIIFGAVYWNFSKGFAEREDKDEGTPFVHG